MRPKYVTIEVATARNVAERYLSQYGKDGNWINTAHGPSKDVYDKLCALGPNPAIDKVAEAIGNKSWSYISCAGCPEYVERAVRIGQDYGTGHVFCATCIQEAHAVLIGEGK